MSAEFFLVNEDKFQERVRELAAEWVGERINELYGDELTESHNQKIKDFLEHSDQEHLDVYLQAALENWLEFGDERDF
jgi:hypothetical protein